MKSNLITAVCSLFLSSGFLFQEPIKSRAPQLHLEYRFYKQLGNSGERNSATQHSNVTNCWFLRLQSMETLITVTIWGGCCNISWPNWSNTASTGNRAHLYQQHIVTEISQWGGPPYAVEEEGGCNANKHRLLLFLSEKHENISAVLTTDRSRSGRYLCCFSTLQLCHNADQHRALWLVDLLQSYCYSLSRFLG